ncbi:MAG: FAD-dependent monooxygenase, partial [Acidimicrobiales bacterium]
MRTQVVIVGAGPAGALLSHMLGQAGVESIVLERQSRQHVLGRIRAGLLEWGTVEVLREAGLSARMDVAGYVHDTINIASNGTDLLSLDTRERMGRRMMAYGQTNIQEDLYEAADSRNADFLFEVDNVVLHDITGSSPYVSLDHNGIAERIDCDFIAGCDGFHGVA